MSKRFNLREFQQQVLDRLQAQTMQGAHASTLGVEIGNQSWLVEMADISEVLPPPALTPVPLTRPWYCGVANVRGLLYSIVDLPAYLDGAALPRAAHNRVLLLNPRTGFNTGLLVTSVLGLRNTAGWAQAETSGQPGWRDPDGRVWRKLDIPALLQQPEFLRIGL